MATSVGKPKAISIWTTRGTNLAEVPETNHPFDGNKNLKIFLLHAHGKIKETK
jgi:hypothetical protein